MLKFFLKRINNRKGFTLVELIVVIAVLGILAGIAVPRFTNATDKAKVNADKVTAKILADAVSMAVAENNIGTDKVEIDSTSHEVDLTTLVDMKYIEKKPVPAQNGKTSFTVTYNDNTIKVYYDDETTSLLYP